MGKKEEALQTKEYFGEECGRVWVGKSEPWYVPCVVGVCHPCVIGVEYEAGESNGYDVDRGVCPSTFGGCFVCCVAGMGCQVCLQGYVTSKLDRGKENVFKECIEYTLWNFLWPCTCGPCISYEVSVMKRKNGTTGADVDIEPLM